MATKAQIRQAAKFYAKRNLSEHFGACVAVSLIASVISSLAASVGTFFGIPMEELLASGMDMTAASELIAIPPKFFVGQGITLLLGFLIAPITIGSYGFYMHLSRNQKMKISDLFIWFGDFSLMGKAIGAMLWYTLLIIGWILAFMGIPFAIIAALAFLPIPETVALILLLPAVLLFIAALIFAEVKINAYTPALYLLAENPEIGVRQSFRNAKEIMRGHAWEYFILQLSFILWHLTASFTCGLSVLYVTPYITMTNCYFINPLIGDYHRRHNIHTENAGEPNMDNGEQTPSGPDDSVKF